MRHPNSLKYIPARVSDLCQRSGYLHRGHALSALGRHEEAREAYLSILPLLEREPRSGRLEWELTSALVNVGNTYSRQGDFGKADEYYNKAEALGKEHIEHEHGNRKDGVGMKMIAMRARAFALKKAGREEEGKKLLKEVLETTIEYQALMKKEKEESAQLEKAEHAQQVMLQAEAQQDAVAAS